MRRFKGSDCPQILEWYRARGITPMAGGSLPEIGYIIPGVAAGFLMQTDTALALIDGLIANPAVADDARDGALDQVVAAVLKTASELGYTHIGGFTKLPVVAQRAKRHGFKVVGEFTMVIKGD